MSLLLLFNQPAGGGAVALVATARVQAIAQAPLPVARTLIASDRSQAQGNAALIRALALQATTRAQSRATGVLPISRALIASAIARSQAQDALVRGVLLLATARAVGMGAAALPVVRQLVAEARGQARIAVLIDIGAANTIGSMAVAVRGPTLTITVEPT